MNEPNGFNSNIQQINLNNQHIMNPNLSHSHRGSQQKIELGSADNFQQQTAMFDQAQNDLNNELKKQRSFHSNVIQEKAQDLNILNGIIENYQRLTKKIQDENNFLLEESRKIEEKKNAALKTIMAFQNNIDILLNKNLEIKQKIFNQTSRAIEEIGETAKITLEQISQSNKSAQLENQGMTLMQRKQMMLEERERERERMRVEENIKPQQQFPKNFDSENFPEVEVKSDNYSVIQKNANIAQVSLQQMSPPFQNENNFSKDNQMSFVPPKIEENSINQMVSPPRNEQTPYYQDNFNQTQAVQMTPPQNYGESDTTNVMRSNNATPQRMVNEMSLNNKMNKSGEFNKNMDSDQKDFANFGGFDMNQQDFNNAGTAGWGEFDNNFKQPGFDEKQGTQNTQNFGFGGGFDNFNFK